MPVMAIMTNSLFATQCRNRIGFALRQDLHFLCKTNCLFDIVRCTFGGTPSIKRILMRLVNFFTEPEIITRSPYHRHSHIYRVGKKFYIYIQQGGSKITTLSHEIFSILQIFFGIKLVLTVINKIYTTVNFLEKKCFSNHPTIQICSNWYQQKANNSAQIFNFVFLFS